MAEQIILPFESRPCTGCLRGLPLNFFRERIKRGRRVRCSRCKDCERTYRKMAYQRADKTVLASRMREYRKKRPDVMAKANTLSYHKFRTKRLRAQSKYYAENRTLRLIYAQRYRTDHASKINAAQKRYYCMNKFRFIKAADDRRARLLNARGDYSIEGWLQKCAFWGWRCYLCASPLTSDTVTIEHRIPLIRGGSNWLANLAPSCLVCNKRKGQKTDSEYRAYLTMIAI